MFAKPVKRLLDATAVRLVNYFYSRLPSGSSYSVLDELARRTAAECADYAQQNMAQALSFKSRENLWDHAIDRRMDSGLLIECGVWSGNSINYFAKKISGSIYGFDSFEGLNEDWHGWDLAKGAFDLGGRMPAVEKNVTLIKGWFDKTIPEFLALHTQPLAFLHVDSDTYEAAKVVLDLIEPRLIKGTVIVFDEYFGYRGWKSGEFKAWQECVAKQDIQYQYLGFSTTTTSIMITGRNSGGAKSSS